MLASCSSYTFCIHHISPLWLNQRAVTMNKCWIAVSEVGRIFLLFKKIEKNWSWNFFPFPSWKLHSNIAKFNFQFSGEFQSFQLWSVMCNVDAATFMHLQLWKVLNKLCVKIKIFMCFLFNLNWKCWKNSICLCLSVSKVWWKRKIDIFFE